MLPRQRTEFVLDLRDSQEALHPIFGGLHYSTTTCRTVSLMNGIGRAVRWLDGTTAKPLVLQFVHDHHAFHEDAKPGDLMGQVAHSGVHQKAEVVVGGSHTRTATSRLEVPYEEIKTTVSVGIEWE